MPGALGGYSMTRESSGTSWQPEATPMDGIMDMGSEWMTMYHGLLDQVHDRQGGPRGGKEDFSESIFMFMAQRRLGLGTLGFHGMFSLDPLMGPAGYPLLLQTGETADGVKPLVDRQHPHDLFMELSASYSHPLSDGQSAFAYAGLPGEPALGPPTFMHRASGEDVPEAPITHHWLDSTHVTFGILTAGWIMGDVKLEASTFHGREPDQFRWNIETGRLDSAAARASWNPGEHWALQMSRGYIHSPEQLEPGVNQRRSTASAMYEMSYVSGWRWAATLAWGQNDNRPGHKLDAWLAESEFRYGDAHTVFLRLERVQEDELFAPPAPQAGSVYGVGKLSVGYIHDWRFLDHLRFGFGALVSAYQMPAAVATAYVGPDSYMLFARFKLD
ncbi:MAG: hypothetical protein ACM3ZT_01100 [Bacillota bacterium]